MKTQITIGVIVALAIASIAAAPKTIVSKNTTQISAKPFGAFNSFKVHRQGRGATSTWGMTSETAVSCYTLQRTYEDPTDPYANWENICIMQCNGSRSYKWTDETVFPGFISYRVIADLTPTGEIISGVETIHIVSH